MNQVSLNRLERKKALRRQSLVDSAKQLFSEKGYAGTTIDDIVAHADVAKVTFYYHFKSKEEVALEIRRQCQEESVAYIEDLRNKNLSAKQMIDAFVKDVAEWTESNWRLLDVFCEQRISPLIKPDEKPEEKVEPMVMCIDAILRKGQETEVFRSDFSTLQVARLLDLAILCEQNKWVRSGRKRGVLLGELKKCFELFLNGIKL